MKKALAIVLLIVFLFNVGGYYIVFWVLQYQYSLKISSIIDSGSYTEDETIELKIPMTLPYPLQPRDFERISGKFEYEGEYYELAKQKLVNDTLHVVVLKNQDQKQLVSSMTDYVKLSNDLPGTAQKAYNFLGKLLKEYKTGSSAVCIQLASWFYQDQTFNIIDANKFPLVAYDIPSPPPKA